MKPKTILLVVITLAALGVGGWNLKNLLSSSEAGAGSARRWFVCTETKKAFQLDLQIGMTIPVKSPYSGKETGYPAELCYWNEDGSIRKEPTPVLLNRYLGDKSPTYCPDCGRLVVLRNPPPEAGKAPPKKTDKTSK